MCLIAGRDMSLPDIEEAADDHLSASSSKGGCAPISAEVKARAASLANVSRLWNVMCLCMCICLHTYVCAPGHLSRDSSALWNRFAHRVTSTLSMQSAQSEEAALSATAPLQVRPLMLYTGIRFMHVVRTLTLPLANCTSCPPTARGQRTLDHGRMCSPRNCRQ